MTRIPFVPTVQLVSVGLCSTADSSINYFTTSTCVKSLAKGCGSTVAKGCGSTMAKGCGSTVAKGCDSTIAKGCGSTIAGP